MAHRNNPFAHTVTSASGHDPHQESNLNCSPGFGISSMRVLVVEDFAPFRKLICSILGKEPGLQIIAEVSDGLEAIRQAEELQPELILDIELPMLNGIAAARQIRKSVPDSKIIFVSQKSSPDVVQEALNLGARGDVVKTRVAIDLLAAVEAVLEGRQFVSYGLSCSANSLNASPAPAVATLEKP